MEVDTWVRRSSGLQACTVGVATACCPVPRSAVWTASSWKLRRLASRPAAAVGAADVDAAAAAVVAGRLVLDSNAAAVGAAEGIE